MNSNNCTYKHKWGKNDGYFCHNKITCNGDKHNYLCTKHNKNHVPKKRIKYNISERNISINSSVKLITKDNKSNFLIKKKFNNNKFINKNIYIKSFDIKKLKTILKTYNNKINKKEDIYYDFKEYKNKEYKHWYFKHLNDNNISNFNLKIDVY